MSQPINREAALSASFLDQLIKRSEAADHIYQECGCRLLQRAVLAGIELYHELVIPPGGIIKEEK